VVDTFTYADFGAAFVPLAVSEDRVRAAVAEIAGDTIEVGPLPAGPGGVAGARATGAIREVVVEADRSGEPLRFDVTLKVDLTLRVEVAGVPHRYQADVVVRLRLSVWARPPLGLFIGVESFGAGDVACRVKADGVRAKVLQKLGRIDDEIRANVARVVNEKLASDAGRAAREIDLLPLIEQAWPA
jgi:hypothetical protein